MDDDLHVNLPGELAIALDETLEYMKLLEPILSVSHINTAVVLSSAILFYRDFWKENCEYYGVLPVKE